MNKILPCLAVLLLLAAADVQGQSTLVARQVELLRLRQLAGIDSGASGSALLANADSMTTGSMVHRTRNGVGIFVLPVAVTLLNNSQLPYDWNLGSMVPAKGLQVQVSAGIAFSWRKWSVKLNPEWVGAQNLRFETMSQELNPQLWRDYFRYYYNITDIPERMGDAPYKKLIPGQSAIRFTGKSFQYTIGTESKWWGPGYRNALVLSSNAPGFLHFSAATRKPLETRWGKLEGEWLSGNLVASGVLPPRRFTAFDGQFVYTEKRNENRFLSGLTVNWQPKWVPGLFLGFAKASYLYYSDIGSPLDLLPLQGLFGEKRTAAEKNGRKASLGSFFMKYQLKQDQAEVYLDYGRKDRATMPWNVLSSSSQRTGFVLGFNKLMELRQGKSHIRLGAELTQLEASDSALVSRPESWYTHNHVRQGYTHLGRSLGAGIGPGSNSQAIHIDWIKGQRRIGIQLERLRHNGDYYYAAISYLGDFRRHWVQLATTLKADWAFGPVSLHGSLGMIRSLNHHWIVVEARPNYLFAAGNEYLNLSGQLTARYRF